jgi:hypothetical protein
MAFKNFQVVLEGLHDDPLPGSNDHGCSSLCLMPGPEKHAKCLAGMLRRFLQLRRIMPPFLLAREAKWRTTCPKLFQSEVRSALPKLCRKVRVGEVLPTSLPKHEGFEALLLATCLMASSSRLEFLQALLGSSRQTSCVLPGWRTEGLQTRSVSQIQGDVPKN